MPADISGSKLSRRKIRVRGVVQGVGFRPFVYRLADELKLTGYVLNDSEGVLIEAQGSKAALDTFVVRMETETPPLAKIVNIHSAAIDPGDEVSFVIRKSQTDQQPLTLISPDVATCDDCLWELFDPGDRRFRYPFINCTNCGPRYTIVEGIPYDRPNTSMKRFPLCPDCAREYHDPTDRRFHAQPNACPVCGPKLTLRSRTVEVPCADPIGEVVGLLKSGKIVAIRGVGGFHLAVDAHNDDAVKELRKRKGRAEKPFALMAPDLESIRQYCLASAEETAMLLHYRRPIVLLKRTSGASIAPSVAPGNRYLGLMLAYSPLHHLLLRGNFEALVMTSANLSEEPIVIGNDEAIARLTDLADFFLFHDREILQRCDDSIGRYAAGAPRLIRRARGYVPEPVFLEKPANVPILACGGELKNTIALTRDKTAFLSQHIGDLDNPEAMKFYEHCIGYLESILGIAPKLIACDLHPEYLSTKWAKKQSLPVIEIQHHHAHMVSVMAENGVYEKTIGIILDGTGYGTDGTIWGGELLVGDAYGFERLAWLDSVPMPGGASAIHEPWRMALSYLRHTYGNDIPNELPFMTSLGSEEKSTILRMIERGINSPMTSSCGRFFDGVAALLGIRQKVSFEAQAAIELEMVAGDVKSTESMQAQAASGALDIRPLIRHIVDGIVAGRPVNTLAAEFHFGLVELFVGAANEAHQKTGINVVGLSGGVYQNVLFFERMVTRLQAEGFTVLTHSDVPTNDGGLALGQVLIADAQYNSGKKL